MLGRLKKEVPPLLPPKGCEGDAPDIARPDVIDAEALAGALTEAKGVVSTAAASLRLERTKLYRLCREHGVDPKAYR